MASPKQRTAWVYLLSRFKWQVLNNGQLEYTFYLVSSGNSLTTDNLSLPLSCFKWQVLYNGQLEFTFYHVSSGRYLLSCFKWSVLNNGQLEFTFIMCQVASSNQRTACKYIFILSQVSSQVCLVKGFLIHLPSYSYLTDNRQHICHLSSYNYLTDSRRCLLSFYLQTAIIRVVGNTCHLSSYSYLTDSRRRLFHFTFIQLSILVVGKTYHLSSNNYHIGSRQSFSPVKLHSSKWSWIPFSSTSLGIPLLFLIPVKSSLSSCIHTCIMRNS